MAIYATEEYNLYVFGSKSGSQSMQLHKFAARHKALVAVTTDRTGANLPADLGPWVFKKSMTVDRGNGPTNGASSYEIIEAVEAKGYFIWPAVVRFNPDPAAQSKRG